MSQSPAPEDGSAAAAGAAVTPDTTEQVTQTYGPESSLTDPLDRNPDKSYLKQMITNQSKPPLTDAELEPALAELNDDSYIQRFPKVERRYADSAVELQRYGLVSFVPAKGATPNKNGVFGWAKLRGNYATGQEANARAAELIKNEDSYHKIYHCYVGRPFPCTEREGLASETEEIELRKDMRATMSESVKQKRKEEQQKIREIQDREEELKRDVEEEEDPMDLYITLRVKKAQLSWTWLEHQKKMAEIQPLIVKAREQIAELEEQSEEFKANYMERYMAARRQSGIPDAPENAQDNFIKFMVEDAELPF